MAESSVRRSTRTKAKSLKAALNEAALELANERAAQERRGGEEVVQNEEQEELESGEECEAGDSGDSGEQCEGGDSGEEELELPDILVRRTRSIAIVEKQAERSNDSRKRKLTASKTPSRTKKKVSGDVVPMETRHMPEGSPDHEPMSCDLEVASRDPEELSCDLPDSGCWKHYKLLCDLLPGREEIVEQLLTLFGEPDHAVYPTLYVYGHTGTGKSLALSTVLKTLEVPHVVVNCCECYSSRVLFESILNQLDGTPLTLTPSSSSSSIRRCPNMAAFVRDLQHTIDSKQLSSQTTYIVLDHAERLRGLEVTVLPALHRLAELCSRAVCVVLISELVWEKLHADTGSSLPLPLHFPDYTKEQTLAIMARDCPAHRPRPFYMTFVTHIWNVFHTVCRDLRELRHLSSLLFPKYCEPVDSEEIEATETRKLWRHIEPFFQSMMSRIYLREVSSSQWERAQSSLSSNPLAIRSTAEALSVGGSTSLELPLYSRYLLIAAYLASYNPAKADKKFFSKQRQSRKSKAKSRPQKEKPSNQLLGPKPFPLDRLMAIFYSILEEAIDPTADIYCQVSSLVTLQLLSQVSTRDVLDSAKYKCLTSFEFIRQVARTVGFDITQYLYDFV